MPNNGQYQISLTKVKQLEEIVLESDRIKREETDLEENEDDYSEGVSLFIEAQTIASIATRIANDPDLECDVDFREEWKKVTVKT